VRREEMVAAAAMLGIVGAERVQVLDHPELQVRAWSHSWLSTGRCCYDHVCRSPTNSPISQSIDPSIEPSIDHTSICIHRTAPPTPGRRHCWATSSARPWTATPSTR